MSRAPLPQSSEPPAVDLVVNCWARNVERVLSPGFFRTIEQQNLRRFARRVALINNVPDTAAAADRARQLQASGEIDEYVIVADEIEAALGLVGLRRSDLGRIPHYTDFLLVAICHPGSEWLLHWDADIELSEPADWIDPAVELMNRDRRILVANPNWSRPGSDARAEARSEVDGFAIGYGFSDQVFLARRSDLLNASYRRRCPASLQYPLAHIAPIFEQRIDAHMRTRRRLRATFLAATYRHPGEGGSHPGLADLSRTERLRRLRNRVVLAAIRRLPTSDPRLRLY